MLEEKLKINDKRLIKLPRTRYITLLIYLLFALTMLKMVNTIKN
jgi:hypothetical protein